MKEIFAIAILLLTILIAVTAQAQAISSNGKADWKTKVIDEVMAMEKMNAEMEAKGQVTEQFDLLSEDYVYIDVSGKRTTKQQLIERREEDNRKSIKNIASQLEVIPLSPELALARGRWDGNAIYYGGLPRSSSSRFMALWKKENGKWKILADQGTPIGQQKVIERQKIEMNLKSLKSFAGSFQLNSGFSLKIEMAVKDKNLVLTIPGNLDTGIEFYPSNNGLFFAKERPWEIQFNQDLDAIIFTSWGIETKGHRLK
jgi:ketosteroid isomerase-like protein/uncharacterized protein YneR